MRMVHVEDCAISNWHWTMPSTMELTQPACHGRVSLALPQATRDVCQLQQKMDWSHKRRARARARVEWDGSLQGCRVNFETVTRCLGKSRRVALHHGRPARPRPRAHRRRRRRGVVARRGHQDPRRGAVPIPSVAQGWHGACVQRAPAPSSPSLILALGSARSTACSLQASAPASLLHPPPPPPHDRWSMKRLARRRARST